MKALIVGAGIGGLTAALCLHANGIEVDIFEAAPQLRPLGLGINVLSHAIAILDDVGVADAVIAAGVQTRELRLVNRHGQTVWGDLRGKFSGASHPQVSIHRGHLQMALYDAVVARIGRQRLHTGAMARSWHVDGEHVRLVCDYSAGNVAPPWDEALLGDVLIGADGIHSVVRQHFYPDEGPPKWNGVMMARGTTYAAPFLDGATMIQAGYAGRKFVCYPITRSVEGGPVLLNWVADLRAAPADTPGREHWNRVAELSDYLPSFADWTFDWLDVPVIMRGAAAVYEFPMVDRDPLTQWSFGRVTLLGDAAHPMYPIGSNGATQAIVDAATLAQSLAEAPTAESGLRAYEALRAPVVARLIALNRQEGLDQLLDLAERRAPAGFREREAVLPQSEIDAIVDEYKRAAGYVQTGQSQSGTRT